MIPDGWSIANLGEVAEVLDPQPDHRTPPEVLNGIPYIGVNDFLPNGEIDIKSCRKVSEEVWLKQQANILVDEGGIIFGKIGTIGMPRMLPKTSIKYALSANVVLIKPKVNRSYILAWLRSEDIQNQIYRTLHTTSQPALGIKKIRELLVNIPPLLEQCKIAEVLGVWDESIDLLERLIGRVRSRKQGLMQQLLTGKKRFKEFEGSEWKDYQLSQIANITMGTSPKSESYNSNKEGLPLLQGNADIKNRVSLPRIWTSEVTKECYPNDILISVRAPVGTVAISLHHACIGRGMASIKAKSKVLPNYLYQLLLFFEPQWASLSQGSTFDSVNSADIKSRIFSIPLMISEQEKIAAVLSAADEEISTLEKQLAAYKQQKLGLMQQLLTGRIRI